jgi:hypothetical protein
MRIISFSLIVSILFLLQSCSIIGLTTGIIYDSKSYDEVSLSADSLKKIKPNEYLKIYLTNGNKHVGRFNKIELLNTIISDTATIDSSKNNLLMKKMDDKWSLQIEKKYETKTFTNDEIEELKVYRNNYASLGGCALGLMIDTVILYLIFKDFHWGSPGG